MDSVQVHIDSYDEISHSLTVHFTGTLNGVEYSTAKYAFSSLAYNPDLVASVMTQFNIDDIIKQLAKIGKVYLEQEVNKQQISNNTSWMNNLKSLSNTSYTVSGSDLSSNNQVNTDIVDNLEIIL